MITTQGHKKELTPEQKKTRKKLLRDAVVFTGQLHPKNVYTLDAKAANGRWAHYDVLNAWSENLHGVALYDGWYLVTAKLRTDPGAIKEIIRQWLDGIELEDIKC